MALSSSPTSGPLVRGDWTVRMGSATMRSRVSTGLVPATGGGSEAAGVTWSLGGAGWGLSCTGRSGCTGRTCRDDAGRTGASLLAGAM